MEQHDPKIYHADDEAYRWLARRYQGKEKGKRTLFWHLHYHWHFDRVPTAADLAYVLAELGPDAVGLQLLDDAAAYFGGYWNEKDRTHETPNTPPPASG